MEKIFNNIRTMAALLMAGAAFAACSNSDDIIENQQPANTDKQGYTLTISASKDGSTTRALDLVGSAVVASWETTDEIVVTKGGTEIGTLSPTDIDISGLEATFTGTISGDADINVDDVLTLTYHPVADFATQNGTLSGSANSAENYDMAVATLTISAITGNTITVSESQANFVNQTAVVVLSPYNSSWEEYVGLASLIVSVTIDVPSVGTVTEHLGPFTLSGGQPYYFALPSQASLAKTLAAKYSLAEDAVSALLASATITFTGQNEGVYYVTCSKTGYKFVAGKYYKLDQSNFSMTSLNKRAAAGKDVYVSSSNTAWSNTVTFAVNKEIGWRIVGDDVYCGDQQLYVEVEENVLGPDPWEGFVKATDSFISSRATYSLRDPAPAGPTAYTLAESTQGMIVGTNGMAYDVADKDNLPSGVTAAGVVVYKNGSNGLAIALTDEASTMNWDTACGENGAAAHTPAVEGPTWKLPSQEEWTLVKNANSGSSLNSAITSAGGTAIPTVHYDHETQTMAGQYWLSTEGGNADIARVWGINGYDEIAVGDASQTLKTNNILVRACLAW